MYKKKSYCLTIFGCSQIFNVTRLIVVHAEVTTRAPSLVRGVHDEIR